MLIYALKRTFVALLILIVVSALTFSLSHLSADPALTIAGEQASEEDIQALVDYVVYLSIRGELERALIERLQRDGAQS